MPVTDELWLPYIAPFDWPYVFCVSCFHWLKFVSTRRWLVDPLRRTKSVNSSIACVTHTRSSEIQNSLNKNLSSFFFSYITVDGENYIRWEGTKIIENISGPDRKRTRWVLCTLTLLFFIAWRETWQEVLACLPASVLKNDGTTTSVLFCWENDLRNCDACFIHVVIIILLF